MSRCKGVTRWWLLGAGLAAAVVVSAGLAMPRRVLGDGLKIMDLPTDARSAVLATRPDTGEPAYQVRLIDGRTIWLDPRDYAVRLHGDYRSRPRHYRVMNISSSAGLAWVGLGLAGQLLFTGRMIVQWLASEKHRRSVIPVAFWWMSLIGATMLLVYFTWRRDIVGVLGQAAGWFIYVRNLWLIHAPHRFGDIPTIPTDETQVSGV